MEKMLSLGKKAFKLHDWFYENPNKKVNKAHNFAL
jgi:hypothetical protein